MSDVSDNIPITAPVEALPVGSFALDDGTEVQVESLHVEWTYRGLLEGVPTKRMNDDILRRFRRETDEAAYTGAALVLDPDRRFVESSKFWTGLSRRLKAHMGSPEVLPALMVRAGLHSYVTFAEDDDATALMVGFFGAEKDFQLAPTALVSKYCRTIRWNKHARGFRY